MKKFKIVLGLQRLDVDFDGVYSTSDFFPFPTVNNLLNYLIVKGSDNYDKYTIVGKLHFTDQYNEVSSNWEEWLKSEEGKIWANNIPEYNSNDYWCIVEKGEEVD